MNYEFAFKFFEFEGVTLLSYIDLNYFVSKMVISKNFKKYENYVC